MSGNQCLALPAIYQRIRTVLRLDLQGSFIRQILEIDAALNLRLDDVVIHPSLRFGMRPKNFGLVTGSTPILILFCHVFISVLQFATSSPRFR